MGPGEFEEARRGAARQGRGEGAAAQAGEAHRCRRGTSAGRLLLARCPGPRCCAWRDVREKAARGPDPHRGTGNGAPAGMHTPTGSPPSAFRTHIRKALARCLTRAQGHTGSGAVLPCSALLGLPRCSSLCFISKGCPQPPVHLGNLEAVSVCQPRSHPSLASSPQARQGPQRPARILGHWGRTADVSPGVGGSQANYIAPPTS